MKFSGLLCLWAGMAGWMVTGLGCHALGPSTVASDRSAYSDSIGESWKCQTLLNIVKLRYLDPPIFVDVGQIIASRSLATGINVGGGLAQQGGNTMNVGGAGTYTESPTITYTPLTGNKFIKSLLTPLPAESVFSMVQSGWPADTLMFATLSSLNGLKNQEATISGTTPPDPRFLRALQLIRKIQVSGGVALRVEKDAQKQQTVLLSFRRNDASTETLEAVAELRQLLKLDPQATEFALVIGATAANDREVAVVTRSILHLMQILATQVDIPESDLMETRATPGWEKLDPEQNKMRMIQIHSAKEYPKNVFVAVKYREQWFWIDDRDLKSKRVFSMMMLLFTLADTGDGLPLPQISIPAH